MSKRKHSGGKTKVYALASLSKGKSEGKLSLSGQLHTIVGELDNHVIVSVPITTSVESAKRLRDELMESTGKPALVVTHNIDFLVARQLLPGEANRIMQRVDNAEISSDGN